MTRAGRPASRRAAPALRGVVGAVLLPAGVRLLGAAARVPVEPDREQARAAAIEELSKREYQAARPGLFSRAVAWLIDQLSRVRLPEHTGSAIGLAALLAVIAAVVLFALARTGGLRGAARLRTPAEVLAASRLDAAGHRAAADRHAAAGEWSAAVLERFRAIARLLEERAILAPSPGRTADEVAAEAAAWLPDLGADLAAAARAFDDVCYGDRRGTPQADAQLRGLDEAVRRARPLALQGAGGPGHGPGTTPAVPS